MGELLPSYSQHDTGQFLYREFCNHVYLGQWELARSCALTICKYEKVDKSFFDKLKGTLKDLAKNPYLVKNSWPKFPCPSYISFLSSKLLLQISEQEEHNDVIHLCSSAEFNVMLEEFFPKFPECQIQELAWIYSTLLKNGSDTESSADDNFIVELSEETLKHIQLSLLDNPSLMLLLLNQLCFPRRNSKFQKLKSQVSDAVLSCFHHCLKQTESFFHKTDEENYIEFVSKSYKNLSLLPDYLIDEQMNNTKAMKWIDEILTVVISLCKSNVLKQEQVYTSLLSRQNCQFLKYFLMREDEFNSQKPFTDFPVLLICGTLDLPGAALWSLKTKCHFLQNILDFSVKKVLAGDFSEVQELLNGPLFTRLLPLILILSWSACKDDFDFANVVQATKSWQPTAEDDLLLVEACNRFLSNISFKERCVEFYVKQFPKAEPSEVITKAHSIFNELQTHSPLDVLQRIFGLKNINSNLVLDLLNCSSQGSCDSAEPKLCSNMTSLAAMRDSIVFHGYRAVILVMEAILYSSEINRLMEKMNFRKVLSTSCKTASSESSENAEVGESLAFQMENCKLHVKQHINEYGIRDTYDKLVLERLEQAKCEIKLLYPITYRIEILENIFSLLFISSKDLYSLPSDSDEGHEGDEKYGNFSLKGSSVENRKGDTDLKTDSVENVTTISEQNYSQELQDKENDGGQKNSGRFVISRVKLKEPAMGKAERSDLYSGTGSSLSTGSSTSNGISTSGFLCNELIVCDLLLLLKDAVLEANVETFKARRDCVSIKEEELSIHEKNLIKQQVGPISSIEAEAVQKHRIQLMQYVEEAYWRYNLVKSDTTYVSSLPKVTFDDSVLVNNMASSLFDSSKLKSCNAEGNENSMWKRKKKRKLKQVLRNGMQGELPLICGGIIHRMLSPPAALLRYCLWHQREEKAMEVIKLYKLQHTVEAQELIFSGQLNQLCENLKKLPNIKEKHEKLNPLTNGTKSSVPDIVAIANAAASGLELTVSSSLIDQETSEWKIPQILEISQNVDCMTHAGRSLLAGADNLCSIALADVAFTRGLPMYHCVTILETVIRQFKKPAEQSVSSQKKNFSFIPGNLKTIKLFSDLLKRFQSFFINTNYKVRPVFFPLITNCAAFSKALVNYIGPFDKLSFAKQLEAWVMFSAHINDFKELLEEDFKTSPSDSGNNCYNPRNKLHIAYKELLKIVNDLCNWSTEVVRPEPVKYKNYLKKLYVYLQQVTDAILGCKDQNAYVGLSSYTSYFSALKESPTDILRKMIDQNKISQQKIEKFAVGMKVDLGHVLLDVFFPPVPLFRESTYNKLCALNSRPNISLGSPGIILNKSDEIWAEPRHPDLVARELLRDLVSMAQDVAMAKDSGSILTTEALLSLSRHSELSSWMDDCCEIAYVDLDLLKSPDELKAFFINVTNLAWAHALLLETLLLNANEVKGDLHTETQYSDTESKSVKTSGFRVPLVVSSSLIERTMQQKNLGYCIGQLGDISLFDLRHNFLHSSFPIPKHLSVPPYNKLFYSPKDLHPTWIKYMPKADSRLLFVLCECMLYSPKLEVMYSDTICDQLDEAMKDFLNYNITVNAGSKLVELPELLDMYSLDFDEGKDPTNSPYEGLLNFLMDFMSPHLAEPLYGLFIESVQTLTDQTGSPPKKQLPFEIQFTPLSLKPGLRMDYSCEDSSEITQLTFAASLEPIVLNYFKDKCPLIADLYKLMTANEQVFLSDENSLSLSVGKHPVAQLLEQRWKMMSEVSNESFTTASQFDWFTSALSPVPRADFTLKEIQNCFNKQQWEKALKYLDIFLEFQESDVDPTFCVLRQLILELLSDIGCSSNNGSSWAWALCISDPVRRAETVIQHLNKWQKDIAVESLKYCLSDTSLKENCSLITLLESKLNEIELYQKILDASSKLETSEQFTSWQDVAEKSIWDQPAIMNCIKKSGEYRLAVEWSKHHIINSSLKLMVWSMHIVSYLEESPPQLAEVWQILHSCSNSSECVELVEHVLPEIVSIENRLFLVQFLVEQGLEYQEQCHYLNMTLGLKMLKSTCSIDCEQYNHLVAHPHLLLEQLLMNMEIEETERALQAISQDLNLENYMGVSVSPLSINRLLENYASKALELRLSDDSNESSASNTTILDSEEISFNVEQFIMPSAIPTQEQWVPDSRIHICQCCDQEQFNMFSRRHHCRRCGRVICFNCSLNTLVLEGYGKHGVRVCDDCYNQTLCSTISAGMSSPFKSSSFNERYRMLSSIKSAGLRNSPLAHEYFEAKRRTSSVTNSKLFFWTLTTNEDENVAARHEFFYDSAPSVSLCLSVLTLHSNPGQCAKFMLTLCDHLINKIRPKPSGKTNSEVDYFLVLSMINTFLVNAQVKYHQLQDHEGEALVDIYFQRSEIIKMLVSSHCIHLIPSDDLLSIETIRKLRDRVLEEERMCLALEISTNCGLDKSGVWSSWGFFCLHAGDWPAAREKFKQCLKVPKDRRKRLPESSTFNRVISFLEKCKYPGQGKAASVYKTLARRDQILKGNTKVIHKMEPFDDFVKEECLYYLNTYGSHFSTVSFFQRHGLIADALTYITKEKCDPEIFVEALFMPALKNSQLSALLQYLSFSDRNLTKSWPYLISTCRFLQRIGYQNVLYQMQLFMEDYIRAAKSSIAFYTSPATTYAVVYFERNHYLYNAKKHFETYLSKCQGNPNYLSQNKNVLTLPEKEVRSYVQTIKLQLELSQFFKQCDSQNLQFLEPKSGSSSYTEKTVSPPTLFSNKAKKAEIASMVLVNSIKIDDGFDLSVKILKEYGLNATSVICAAGRELVRLQWVEHIPHFLQNIKCCFQGMVKDDDIIMECINSLHKQGKDTDFLAKMLTSDASRVNAYLLTGKLKNAYLLAIKLQRPQDIRRIMKAAEQTGQDAVQRFCERWLLSNTQKSAKKPDDI